MNKFQSHAFWAAQPPEPTVPGEALLPFENVIRVVPAPLGFQAILWPDEIAPIILGAATTRTATHLAALRGMELYDVIPTWQRHGPLLENPFLDGPTKFQIMCEVYAIAEKGIQL